MSRIVDREARRSQIVSAAAAVFSQRGVAATTVSDIVKSACIAQGTFYLYFQSKDEAVLAVAERFGDALIEGIEHAVASPDLSAVQKLLSLRDTLSDATASAGTPELIEIMHRPGNRAIHDRFAEHLTPRLVEIVRSIVDQGAAEGVFDVPTRTRPHGSFSAASGARSFRACLRPRCLPPWTERSNSRFARSAIRERRP